MMTHLILLCLMISFLKRNFIANSFSVFSRTRNILLTSPFPRISPC